MCVMTNFGLFHSMTLVKAVVVNDPALFFIKDQAVPPRPTGLPKAGSCLHGGLAARSVPSPGDRTQSQDEDQTLLICQLGISESPSWDG